MGLFGKAFGRNPPPSYGAVDNSPPSPSLVPKLQPTLPRPSSRPGSPFNTTNGVAPSPSRTRIRAYDLEDLIEQDEDADDDVEELVHVPYQILVRNYTLVPLCSILFLAALIGLFNWAWPPQRAHPGPHLPSILVGASAWIISYTLRLPIFTLSTCFSYFANAFTLTLSTVFSIALEEALRLGALVLLGLRLDDQEDWDESAWPTPSDEAFHKTFWLAVGWAVVEVAWSVVQGYEQLSLYRDLLPPSPSFLQQYWPAGHQEQESPTDDSESESISHRYVHAALKKSASPPDTVRRSSRHPSQPPSAIESGLWGEAALDAEVRELINLQTRTELEQVYGVPPPNIPVFISVLQRLDSILLTLGLTLTISSVYLTQLATRLSLPPTSSIHPVVPAADVQAALVSTLPTYVALVLLHSSLALMWTEALPRIGVHTASYAALLVSLGVFFAGLAWWGALS